MAGFSERLRSLRAENRLIQSDLAKLLEVTEATISYYESGRNAPNIDIVKRLATHFKVSSDYMIGLSDYRRIEVPVNQLEESLALVIRDKVRILPPKYQREIAEFIEFKIMLYEKYGSERSNKLKRDLIKDKYLLR